MHALAWSWINKVSNDKVRGGMQTSRLAITCDYKQISVTIRKLLVANGNNYKLIKRDAICGEWWWSEERV